MSKFQFILRTHLDSGKSSETVLAETNNRPRSAMLRNRFVTLAGGTLRERSCKKVKVLKVDADRLAIFTPLVEVGMLPKKGMVFDSIDALAEAMDANPVTLRAAVSVARKNKNPTATVRGVTFCYVV